MQSRKTGRTTKTPETIRTRSPWDKIAAKRIGRSLKYYRSQIRAGKRWCSGCKAFHPASEFPRDSTRQSGYALSCRKARAIRHKLTYKPKGRPKPTTFRRVPERAGDKKQARDRVNYLVRAGLLPRATSVPCVQCGKNYGRREYHHYLGYGVGCHDKVIALCTWCHAHADSNGQPAGYDEIPD